MRTQLFDPTFRTLQHEPPSPKTTGQVIAVADAGNYLYTVSFLGQSITCRSAGKRELAVGDIVSFIENQAYPWIIKSDALYPSRYKKNLADFANSKPASVFLSYIQKDNPKYFTYHSGTIAAVIDSSTVSVICWDGVTRSLAVEYPGETADANEFDVGDPCLIYRKSEGTIVAIGKAATESIVDISARFYTLHQSPNGMVGGLCYELSGASDLNLRLIKSDLTFEKNITPGFTLSVPGSLLPVTKFLANGNNLVFLNGQEIGYLYSGSYSIEYSTDNGASWNSVVDPGRLCDISITDSIMFAITSIPDVLNPSVFAKIQLPDLTEEWSTTSYSGSALSHFKNRADTLFDYESALYDSAKSVDLTFQGYFPCESGSTNPSDFWVTGERIWQAGTGLYYDGTPDAFERNYDAMPILLNDGTLRRMGGFSPYDPKCYKFSGGAWSVLSLPAPYNNHTVFYGCAIDSAGNTYYNVDKADYSDPKLIRFPASMNT